MGIVNVVLWFVAPIRNRLRSADDTGANIVEYAFLLVLVAVVAIVALQLLGGSLDHSLSNSGGSIANP
jgi:Flp pilus assembly pilin Flp